MDVYVSGLNVYLTIYSRVVTILTTRFNTQALYVSAHSEFHTVPTINRHHYPIEFIICNGGAVCLL